MFIEDFVKFPRTPHLFGSSGTDDDIILSNNNKYIDKEMLFLEKIDGDNIGISFNESYKIFFQHRGDEIKRQWEHYDFLKKYCFNHINDFYDVLGKQYILFIEYMYSKHTIKYTKLPHYLIGISVYDKTKNIFLKYDQPNNETLTSICNKLDLPVVRLIQKDKFKDLKQVSSLVKESPYGATKMEGVYMRIEDEEKLVDWVKYVDPEFRKNIGDIPWYQKPIEKNLLKEII